MDWRQTLAQAGMDVPGVLARFCGNEALLLRFVQKFSQDQSFELLRNAVRAGDEQAALAAVHTLKGVAGNLGFQKLFEACGAMTEALRRGEGSRMDLYYEKVREEYERAVAGIAAIV